MQPRGWISRPDQAPFVEPWVLAALGTLTREDVDRLEYGAIKLDDDGTVLIYSRYESDLSGIPREKAEGRLFFTVLAPCTNNRLFRYRFTSGLAAGSLNEVFNYTFTYRMRPTPVRVQMHRDPASGANWLFVKKA